MTGPQEIPNDSPAGTAVCGPAERFRARLKAGALLAFLLLTIVGLRYTGAGASLSKERIRALVGGCGLLAPAAHVALYALGTTALLPATLFNLVGAVVFGKFLGSLYNVLGAIAGAALSFMLSRTLGRECAVRWLRGRLRGLDRRAERHGFSLICYLRLAYLPFAPLNYAAGLTGMRLPDFLLGTAVGILPVTFILTYFVDELTNLQAAGDLLSLRFLTPLVFFGLSWLLPLGVRRLAPGLSSAAGKQEP